MLKMLYILGMCAVVAACIILMLCAAEWRGVDSELDEIRGGPSVLALFKERARRRREGPGERTSPLVAQAQQLASYLNPPLPSAATRSVKATPRLPSRPAPEVQPAAPSLKFALHGTSYYPNQPGRSMALISEPGGSEADGKWVKEGDVLGHFVVHEIRKGIIVFRNGDDLCELAVQRRRALRSLVRDVRPSSHKVSAAVDESGIVLPPPAGPNTVRGLPRELRDLNLCTICLAEETAGDTLVAMPRGPCIEYPGPRSPRAF